MAARERETAATTDKGHGRLEGRTLTATGALNAYLGWPGVQQAFRLVRERTVHGQTTVETVYGITSLSRAKASAAQLLQLTRQHWGIESLFHIRDVTFGEDACRVRTDCAPLVLSGLRNLCIHLLAAARCKNKAAIQRRHAAHPLEALALLKSG